MGVYVYLHPPRVELRGSKDCHLLKYYNVQKRIRRNWFTLGLGAAKNSIICKNASNKSCQTLNSIQKSQWAHISIPPPRGGARGPKITIFWNIMVFKNGKVDSLWSLTLLKLRTIPKNASNKSCWALNSIQKSQWMHKTTAHDYVWQKRVGVFHSEYWGLCRFTVIQATFTKIMINCLENWVGLYLVDKFLKKNTMIIFIIYSRNELVVVYFQCKQTYLQQNENN